MGRRVRKAIGSRAVSEGHVCSYDISSRLYQVLQSSSHSDLFKQLYKRTLRTSLLKSTSDNRCR